MSVLEFAVLVATAGLFALVTLGLLMAVEGVLGPAFRGEDAMHDEHWCWRDCCDLGPHGCVCGHDCDPSMYDGEVW